MKSNPGVLWIKIAIVYFVIGVCFGMYMAASHDHSLFPVHAHINLLGWVSMALIGLIYLKFPQAANSALQRWQFWLHNLGLPISMVSLTLFLRGNEALEPIVAVSSAAMALGVILFAINVFRNIAGRE